MHLRLWLSEKLRGTSAALLLLWLGLSAPAQATTLVPMDLEALSTTAERILVGTVENIESHYLSSQSRQIVTDVTVRSERNLLGVPEGARFVVRHLGGIVGELGQRVYGEASYHVGEQVLLFATPRQGSYYAVGMAQGALHIYRDSAGVARVEANLAGAELIGPAKTLAPSGAAPTLNEVVAQVETYLSRRTSPATLPAVRPQRRE